MKTIQNLFGILTMIAGVISFNHHVCAQTVWKTEPNSEIKFTIKNAGIAVDGKFKTFTADIKFDPEHLDKSQVEGNIDVNSIDTGIGSRDKHLRSEDYFDVPKYPKITFKSEQIFKYEGNYVARGKLTIKNITKEILIPIHFTPKEGNKAHFKSTILLNRIDYGVGGKSLMMSDELTATLEIEVSK
jgi:polyisoprenoid-binding protein YceI